MRTASVDSSLSPTPMRPRLQRATPIAALLGTLLVAVSCAPASGGAPAPGAPPAAPARAEPPDTTPAHVDLVLADTGLTLWNRTMRVLDDSLYHFGSGSPRRGYVTAVSLARRIRLRIDMAPAGAAGDSTRLVVSGRRYAGDTSRPGRISARAEDWVPITASDDERDALRHVAEALRAAPAERPVPSGLRTMVRVAEPGTRDTQLVELPGGRRGYCKANHVRSDDWVTVDNVDKADWCPLSPYERARTAYNTYVLENPHDKPVGATMSACAYSEIPAGWATVEWYTDPAHCPFDPSWKYKSDPNMILIERVR